MELTTADDGAYIICGYINPNCCFNANPNKQTEYPHDPSYDIISMNDQCNEIQLCFTFLPLELITHHDLCPILVIYDQKGCFCVTVICQPIQFGKCFHQLLFEYRKKMECQILMGSYKHLLMFITSMLAAISLQYLLYN